MAFPNDGRNHHAAIENEKNTEIFLRQHAYKFNLFNLKKDNYQVIHKGGTKNKADNVIVRDDGTKIYISDKQKKNGLSGSYDYQNSSAAITSLIERDHPAVQGIQDFYHDVKKDRKLILEERERLVEKYREKITDVSYETLVKLASMDIIYLIKEFLIKPNQEIVMLITDNKQNERYLFPFMMHPVVKYIENGFKASIDVKKGKKSGKIIFKGAENPDIGLRIRVHNNNGATATLDAGNLKKKNRNRSSVFTIKFQQDNLKNLFNILGLSPIKF